MTRDTHAKDSPPLTKEQILFNTLCRPHRLPYRIVDQNQA